MQPMRELERLLLLPEGARAGEPGTELVSSSWSSALKCKCPQRRAPGKASFSHGYCSSQVPTWGLENWILPLDRDGQQAGPKPPWAETT